MMPENKDFTLSLAVRKKIDIHDHMCIKEVISSTIPALSDRL